MFLFLGEKGEEGAREVFCNKGGKRVHRKFAHETTSSMWEISEQVLYSEGAFKNKTGRSVVGLVGIPCGASVTSPVYVCFGWQPLGGKVCVLWPELVWFWSWTGVCVDSVC